MTPEQITLVQTSFAKVEPIAPMAAQLFYARLFEIAPEVQPLFKGNMDDQGAKLMTMLGTVVRGLNRLEAIVPVAQVLAKRHVGYGVTADQYAPVGAALLDTLEKGLGDAFTPEVKAAWAAAYGLLAKTMIDAAYAA